MDISELAILECFTTSGFKNFLYVRIFNGVGILMRLCVQTHLPPTVKQPLYYKYPMTPVTVVSVSNQQRQLTRYISTFPKHTVQTRQFEPTVLFERSPFQNKQVCR